MTSKPSSSPKGNLDRRSFILGGVAGCVATLAGVGVNALQEPAKETKTDVMDVLDGLDSEAKLALKLKGLLESIDLLKWSLEDRIEQKTPYIDPSPRQGSEASSNDDFRRLIDLIIAEVNVLEQEGVKLNSGVVYKHIRGFDKFVELFKGHETHGQFVQFLNPLLQKLKVTLGKIANVNVADFSNNRHVNKEKQYDVPRKNMTRGFSIKISKIKAEIDGFGGGSCPDGAIARHFLEEFGFVEYPEDVMPSPGDFSVLNKYTTIGSNAFVTTMRIAIQSAKAYKANGTTSTGPQIIKLQEMLARGGYLDYKTMDSTYGEETDKAFRQALSDIGYEDNFPEFVFEYELEDPEAF